MRKTMAVLILVTTMAALTPGRAASETVDRESQKRSTGHPERSEAVDDLDFHALIMPVSPENRLSSPDFYTWGASVVKGGDGNFHMFYSRWSRAHGFSAWVTHSEVAHAVSDSPAGPFTHVNVALPARGPQHWDGHDTHNPTIHCFDGKYYLYYTGNYGDGKVMRSLNWTHRNHQRIGVAVADSPNGPWMRRDAPIIDVSKDGDAPDALCIANPSVTRMHDGRFLMVYKAVGRQRKLPFGGPVVHLTAVSDSPVGPFVKQLKPIFIIPGHTFPAEDPYIWYQRDRKRYYALAKDMRGGFTGRGKSTALFTSTDGMDWMVAGHPFALALMLKQDDGVSLRFDNLERPQLLLDAQGRPQILYLATRRGDEAMNIHVPLRPMQDVQNNR